MQQVTQPETETRGRLDMLQRAFPALPSFEVFESSPTEHIEIVVFLARMARAESRPGAVARRERSSSGHDVIAAIHIVIVAAGALSKADVFPNWQHVLPFEFPFCVDVGQFQRTVPQLQEVNGAQPAAV
jgi:hypothetical protein